MDEWGVTKSITPKINHLSDRSGEIYRVRLGGSGRQSLQQHSGGGQGGVPPHSSTKLAWWLGGVPPPDRSSTRQIQAGGVHLTTNAAIRRGGGTPPRGTPVHYRRLGGAQPGNRFVSFVRAYARSGCLVELDIKRCCPPFSLFPFWPDGLSFFSFGPKELSLFPSPHPPNLLSNFCWAYLQTSGFVTSRELRNEGVGKPVICNSGSSPKPCFYMVVLCLSLHVYFHFDISIIFVEKKRNS